MTKVINSTSSKTIGTNKLNTVDVNTDKIIKSDSEFREVVKKGYLLNNINLSTIPDIIQNAINQAILDAKEQTLADAMIETLRLSILNLDDGIYKKTYIDNTITYLENLLVSKASPEIAASIAEAKIAVATAEFATTSQVNILSSRVNSSEVEIVSIKETITTKDSARALQINELEASINDTFSAYSEAIDLIVDTNGNVKSQKIETLSTNIGLQLQEVNQLIVDTNNEWNAKSIKLITSPSGAITGYSFQDGSGIKSNFDIYANNFKISNSYNTYSPFSIIGTSLYFNGKVTFSNVTGTDGVVTTSNVQTVFNSNITTIDGGKIVTNQALVNNLNATGGIIAETVTANEFVGKTFTGAVINGAIINGAVVKASYLDLDGQLEVLTNYHITVAMYNANPSLYSDAVYISGSNEYRIPSISTVSSLEKVKVSNFPYVSPGIYTLSSDIYSYASANIGTNIKAVKSTPTINFSQVLDNGLLSENRIYSSMFTSNISAYFKLYIGNLLVLSAVYSSTAITYSGLVGNGSIAKPATNSTNFATVSYGGMSFKISFSNVSNVYMGSYHMFIDIFGESNLIPNVWSSGQIYAIANSVANADTSNCLIGFRLPAITINNMI